MAEVNVVSSSSRIAWIDVFKGIGILLVVIGHSGIPQKLTWWIWSFHMPMFFFISGFLFSPGKNPSFKAFLTKRVKMLLLPYFIYTIFIMICLYGISFISNIKVEASKIQEFINVLLFGWNGLALWFIPVLFFSEIVFYGIKRVVDNHYGSVILIVVFAVVAYFLGKEQVRLAYKLEVVPGALVFYALGSVLNSYLVDFIKKNKNILLLLLAILFFILNVTFCFINNVSLDMCYNKMGNFFYTYISAVSGVFCTLLSSYFLSKQLGLNNPLVGILTFFGKNTLIIVLLHQLIKLVLNVIVEQLSPGGIIATGVKHVFFWIIMVFIIKFINRYLYFTLGRTASIA